MKILLFGWSVIFYRRVHSLHECSPRINFGVKNLVFSTKNHALDAAIDLYEPQMPLPASRSLRNRRGPAWGGWSLQILILATKIGVFAIPWLLHLEIFEIEPEKKSRFQNHRANFWNSAKIFHGNFSKSSIRSSLSRNI